MQRRALFDPVVKVVSATLNASNRMLELSYTEVKPIPGSEPAEKEENCVERFPYVWLRDCCRCAECHHASTHSRRIAMIKFDAKCTARSAEVESLVYSTTHVLFECFQYLCVGLRVGEGKQRKRVCRDLLGECSRVAVPCALAVAQRLLGAREGGAPSHRATGRPRLLEEREF